jgi:hypothetical protein
MALIKQARLFGDVILRPRWVQGATLRRAARHVHIRTATTIQFVPTYHVFLHASAYNVPTHVVPTCAETESVPSNIIEAFNTIHDCQGMVSVSYDSGMLRRWRGGLQVCSYRA